MHKVETVLGQYRRGELLSYIDLQRMEVFKPVAFAMLVAEIEGPSVDLSKWSQERGRRGFFRYEGRLVKQSQVPEEVREHFSDTPIQEVAVKTEPVKESAD